MDDEAKILITLFCAVALVLCVAIGSNVAAEHDCKVRAIAAGMKADEIKVACK